MALKVGLSLNTLRLLVINYLIKVIHGYTGKIETTSNIEKDVKSKADDYKCNQGLIF